MDRESSDPSELAIVEPRATKLTHLADAVAAEELALTDDEIKRLEEPYVSHPVLGHF
jgi:aryl-alcohol dehydrogenase-like predicted oxidoreductase